MITLVTGGARSGKSSFAEGIFTGKENVLYIATAKIEDREMEERVLHHQKNRNPSWKTIETRKNIATVVGAADFYLLDCITIFTSNIMYEHTKEKSYIDYKTQATIKNEVMTEITALVKMIRSENKNLVMVTNELGFSLVPEHHVSRVFRDMLGWVNQEVAALADEVFLIVSGLPIALKEVTDG